MAQKVNIVLVDDLDHSEADETVQFALDGTSYEIDLSTEHAGALREALAPYVGVARRVSAKSGRRMTSTNLGPSTKEVRDWARSNGYEVSDRGRVPSEVRKAFDAAH